MKTPLAKSPPPVCPSEDDLQQLEARARTGERVAVEKLRALERQHRERARQCMMILERLDPKFTRKGKSRSTPTNALATMLLQWVIRLKKFGRVRGSEGLEIEALKPLTKESFQDWFHCAWKLTKDENICDAEMLSLIVKISESAGKVRLRLEARKATAIKIIGDLAPLTTLDNYPERKAKALRQLISADRELMDYVRRQTYKAAKSVWPVP